MMERNKVRIRIAMDEFNVWMETTTMLMLDGFHV